VSLILNLTWQALRGQSLVAPDGATLLAIGVWFAASAGAAVYIRTGAAMHSSSLSRSTT
jgi:hypothetical protein